jgi:hypothetical protein
MDLEKSRWLSIGFHGGIFADTVMKLQFHKML